MPGDAAPRLGVRLMHVAMRARCSGRSVTERVTTDGFCTTCVPARAGQGQVSVAPQP